METGTSGRWVEIVRTWHDTAVTNCALCGRLVPRRVWLVAFDGTELPFCNEECEGLYRSYWLPKYGKALRNPGNQGRRGVGPHPPNPPLPSETGEGGTRDGG